MNIIREFATTIKNLAYNDLCSVEFLIAGTATAAVVNVVAKNIFTPKKDSNTYFTIKAGAVLAGITACILIPKPSLASFPGQSTLNLIALVIVNLITKSENAPFSVIIGIGFPVGYLGTKSLVVIGSIGAVLGAFNSDNF